MFDSTWMKNLCPLVHEHIRRLRIYTCKNACFSITIHQYRVCNWWVVLNMKSLKLMRLQAQIFPLHVLQNASLSTLYSYPRSNMTPTSLCLLHALWKRFVYHWPKKYFLLCAELSTIKSKFSHYNTERKTFWLLFISNLYTVLELL